MKLFEYEGKALLKRMGISTPSGKVVNRPAEAVSAGDTIGYPVMLKAQVLQGKRGKAGGVQFASGPQEILELSKQLLSQEINSELVTTLLVEKKLDVARELYLGITFDQKENMPVLLLSRTGGVDVEQNAADNATAMQCMVLNPLYPPALHRIVTVCLGGGLHGPILPKVADVARKLIKGYFYYDAVTAEINPLVIDRHGAVWAADSKFALDPSASFRYPSGIPRERKAVNASELEVEASEKGLAYVQLEDGNIGVIAGGAGLCMATMDMVVAAGGRPANFLDLGGGTSSEKTTMALRLVLKTPGVEGVIMNLFGGINNCRVMAEGIAEVVRMDKPKVPIVVKMRGYSQDGGWQILEAVDIPSVKDGTTESAVKLLMKHVAGRGI